MGIEFELKYSANAEQLAAIRQAYSGTYHTYHMETTYYDTADFSLSDRHITLRRRMENDVSVCTVKTPVSELGRGEWELVCDDIHAAIEQLCNIGAPRELLYLTAAGISPVCGAKFTRQALILEHKGSKLELALDEGILTGGDKSIPLCEVEVELKEGDTDTAVAFAQKLAQDFGLTPEKRSKFRRSLSLARGQ